MSVLFALLWQNPREWVTHTEKKFSLARSSGGWRSKTGQLCVFWDLLTVDSMVGVYSGGNRKYTTCSCNYSLSQELTDFGRSSSDSFLLQTAPSEPLPPQHPISWNFCHFPALETKFPIWESLRGTDYIAIIAARISISSLVKINGNILLSFSVLKSLPLLFENQEQTRTESSTTVVYKDMQNCWQWVPMTSTDRLFFLAMKFLGK